MITSFIHLRRSEFLRGIMMTMFGLFFSTALAQNFNPPYPRIGIVTFYNIGAGDEIWRDFDLVVIRHGKGGDARRVKQKNPDVIVLATNDLIDDQTGALVWPAAWRARYADGSEVFETDHLPNTTDWCPVADFGFGSQRYNEWIVQYLFENTDWSVFDGLFFDTWHSGIWYNNPSQMDFDLDGVADGGAANSRYLSGLEKIVNELRDLTGKPVAAHEAGVSQATHLSGVGDEDWGAESGDWSYSLDQMLDWEREAQEPRINFINIAINHKASSGQHRASDDYAYVRFGLATAAVGGFYAVFDEGVSAHRYTYLYDEYRADLGLPTSSAQQIPGMGDVWVCFFDKGAVIVNGSGSSQTVTDGDLRALNGYDNSDGDGYWRFLGAQDRGFNNGEAFISVSLQGSGSSNTETGDGIFIFEQPTTLVTPIVIDNEPVNMTSVGQSPAKYSGSWNEVERNDSVDAGFYGLGYGWDDIAQPFRVSAGTGTATYNASIKLPGEYEVYEWHPNVATASLGSSCSNVPLTISHAGGQTSLKVDQSVNSARWNSIGSYTFNGSASVELRGQGGCTTASDAIRFVYKDSSTVADSKAPDSPKGVKVEQDQ